LVRKQNIRKYYYAFGGELPGRKWTSENYRYGYQGQEKPDATNSSNPWYSFELRMYNQDIGRWFAPDPYGQYHSPYLAMGNNPVNQIDPDGGVSKSHNFVSGTYLRKGTIQVGSYGFQDADMEFTGHGVNNNAEIIMSKGLSGVGESARNPGSGGMVSFDENGQIHFNSHDEARKEREIAEANSTLAGRTEMHFDAWSQTWGNPNSNKSTYNPNTGTYEYQKITTETVTYHQYWPDLWDNGKGGYLPYYNEISMSTIQSIGKINSNRNQSGSGRNYGGDGSGSAYDNTLFVVDKINQWNPIANLMDVVSHAFTGQDRLGNEMTQGEAWLKAASVVPIGTTASSGVNAAKGLIYHARVSASKDFYHNFPVLFDSHIIENGAWSQRIIDRANWFELPGTINGTNGMYSIGINNSGIIFHRGFVPH